MLETITTIGTTDTTITITPVALPACTVTATKQSFPAMTFYRPDVVKVVTTAANQKLVITVAGASLSTPTVYKGTYTATSGTVDSNWCNALTSSTSTNTAAVSGTDYTALLLLLFQLLALIMFH